MTSSTDMSAEMASKRRGLKIHGLVFAVVITFLAGVDWYFAEPTWIHWVVLGWGTGLAVHAWFALAGAKSSHA